MNKHTKNSHTKIKSAPKKVKSAPVKIKSTPKKVKSATKTRKKNKKTTTTSSKRTQNKNGLSYVENLKDLKTLLSQGYYEFLLQLGGGIAFSRKDIHYNNKTKKYEIFNYIDDTEQNLTEKELMNTKITNIGLGIKKRCLIVNLKETQ